MTNQEVANVMMRAKAALQAVAPYMAATNEPWESKVIKQGNFKQGESREVMRTWKNPNEGWWDAAIDKVIKYIAISLNGDLKRS